MNTSYPKLFVVISALGLCSGVQPIAAQRPAKVDADAILQRVSGGLLTTRPIQPSADMKVANCLRQISPDSVHLFFGFNYALSEEECAAIRRECRMDATTGDYRGQVRDYRKVDNRLLQKITYANGLRNGRYEKYDEKQHLAVRGQYTDGSPSGRWHFWYPNGEPRQTLQWTGQSQPALRVLNYWDESGNQLVIDGEGTWQGTTEGQYSLRYSGAIVHGYQQGDWECHTPGNEMLTIEEFDQGIFKQGQQIIDKRFAQGNQEEAQVTKYTTRPMLELQLTDESLQAEPLHLGLSCRQLVARTDMLRSFMSKAQARDGLVVEVPRPQPSPRTYQDELLRRLNNTPALMQLMPHEEHRTVIIAADVDETGHLRNIVAAAKELIEPMTALLTELAGWRPANINGKPVAGRICIILSWQRNKLVSNIESNTASPMRPSEVFD